MREDYNQYKGKKRYKEKVINKWGVSTMKLDHLTFIIVAYAMICSIFIKNIKVRFILLLPYIFVHNYAFLVIVPREMRDNVYDLLTLKHMTFMNVSYLIFLVLGNVIFLLGSYFGYKKAFRNKT